MSDGVGNVRDWRAAGGLIGTRKLHRRDLPIETTHRIVRTTHRLVETTHGVVTRTTHRAVETTHRHSRENIMVAVGETATERRRLEIKNGNPHLREMRTRHYVRRGLIRSGRMSYQVSQQHSVVIHGVAEHMRTTEHHLGRAAVMT